MINNASNFIRNRGNDITTLTSTRIDAIIWYVAECYQLIKKDNPRYDFKKLKLKSKIKQEDYLRFRLVTDYLRKNKSLIKTKCSDLSEIEFHCEEQFEYFDLVEQKENADKIDITVSRLGLQEIWNDDAENIYFAIECKRIKILSDCEDYILDTEKFANRNYTSTRLSFEGQLAFIENSNLNHSSVSNEINRRLPTRTKLRTKQLLKNVTKHALFNECYHSVHNRNTKPEQKFEVLHLLLLYSPFVVN
jgi:hypothetical protein